MPLQYKYNVLEKLRKNDITTYRIRKERLLSESTVQKLRNEKPVSWENLESLCSLLNCQPGDIIEFIPVKNIME